MTVSSPTSSEIDGTLVDPFARVLALDELGERRLVLSFVMALVLYAALAGQAFASLVQMRDFAASVERALERKRPPEIDIETPPPPPPPEPEPPEPTPAPEPVKDTPPPKAAAPQAPPAAAQAGKILTAAPDPDEPVDLTGQGFVQGTGDSFAGGVTTSNGTSKTAVRDLRAAGAGEPVPVAAKAAPGGPNLSRAAGPLSGQWECGFPAEADIEQINSARVAISVTVAADGHAERVNVLTDPGYGFGALAKRCALRTQYRPALGRDGVALTTTQVININFVR